MTESKGLKDQNGPKDPGAAPRNGLLQRWRPYAAGVVVIAVVFGASAAIGAHVRGAKADRVKAPANATGPEGRPKLAVPVKPTIPVTLTVYEDLRSPQSKAFAEQYADAFAQLLVTGQVQIEYRLVTQTDAQLGGTGSKAAANAAACAQDQGRYTEFVKQIWQQQPDPQNDALSSQKLLKELSKKAGKIDEGKFVPCMQGGDHDGWVAKSQADFLSAQLGTVPVVQINGEAVPDVQNTLTPFKLRSLVEKAAKKASDAVPSGQPSLAS
ncbi:thioredoxin domain-containing protein [Streptomyces sp. H10-C2]|uniref:DsbA family protein n=1 Tax=unclassified Streptomyces TaxID=2593676 RepID=UPI0024BB97C3|nr:MULTISPECIES: thioredoxin domain-containing protein [unclassified Streptomyces]MDJ0344678.1 thioredoxin domain-containing protein [Streptomyces sp. PH10-H1]MDJ0372838.1 thioredoxin domain-containing protein [Streptomyces sp. H10-C2]